MQKFLHSKFSLVKLERKLIVYAVTVIEAHIY